MSAPGEWPPDRWQLTAPESYVLRAGSAAEGREAFKYALKDLLARGALLLETVETKRALGRRKRTVVVREGPAAASVNDPSLLTLLVHYRTLSKHLTWNRRADEGERSGLTVGAACRAGREHVDRNTSGDSAGGGGPDPYESADWGHLDFGGLEGMDGAFGAIDAGVDAAEGDRGDGGGGD